MAELAVQGRSPSGVVLDLIKAFNVVCRPFLQALMVRLGFSKVVIEAWIASMKDLVRQPLVAGAVFGESSSTTGIPEGDPMSVLGMFALCCLFRDTVSEVDQCALVFSYADNWEVVADQVTSLQFILKALDDMLQVCLLPVAPSKCWTWALCAKDRRVLNNCQLASQKVPVKTTGCCLGADMSYSFRIAAATRNQRVAKGHRRLLRLRGIPTSRFRKCRLVLSGVFPQSLHACEASWVPGSVFDRLRSKVVQALKLDGSGVNPYLACCVAAPKLVDPEFVALISRIRLFRQLWRDFGNYRPILLARLASQGSRFKTPTDHLGRALRALGWEFVDGTNFRDGSGRSFSLHSSSLGHIRSLLLFQWGHRVSQAVCHRKGLDSIHGVDTEFSRPSKSLLPSERGLLGQLVSGRHFTRDAQSKFAGATCDDVCPHCHQAEDGREHRVFNCPAFEVVRWHYREVFQLAPQSALLYGLWPFPDGLLEWQASLDQLVLPVITRSLAPHKVCFFTDGSCLFPALADIRVASAAVVQPSGPGTFDLVWSGILPTSNQTIQRAEILAGTVATASALHPVVISDSLYFVRWARRLLECWVNGVDPVWPVDNLDLWEFFWEALSGCTSAEFVWTKAHRSFVGLEGLDLLIAQGNDAADQHAKECVKFYQSKSMLYRRVVKGKLRFLRARSLLDAFHIQPCIGSGRSNARRVQAT